MFSLACLWFWQSISASGERPSVLMFLLSSTKLSVISCVAVLNCHKVHLFLCCLIPSGSKPVLVAISKFFVMWALC